MRCCHQRPLRARLLHFCVCRRAFRLSACRPRRADPRRLEHCIEKGGWRRALRRVHVHSSVSHLGPCWRLRWLGRRADLGVVRMGLHRGFWRAARFVFRHVAPRVPACRHDGCLPRGKGLRPVALVGHRRCIYGRTLVGHRRFWGLRCCRWRLLHRRRPAFAELPRRRRPAWRCAARPHSEWRTLWICHGGTPSSLCCSRRF